MTQSLRIYPTLSFGSPQLIADGDSTLLVHPSTSFKYRLNPTALAIWEAVQEPTSVSEVRDHVLRTFDVSIEEASADVDGFLDQLAELGLVELRPADAAAEMRFRYLDRKSVV